MNLLALGVFVEYQQSILLPRCRRTLNSCNLFYADDANSNDEYSHISQKPRCRSRNVSRRPTYLDWEGAEVPKRLASQQGPEKYRRVSLWLVMSSMPNARTGVRSV